MGTIASGLLWEGNSEYKTGPERVGLRQAFLKYHFDCGCGASTTLITLQSSSLPVALASYWGYRIAWGESIQDIWQKFTDQTMKHPA